MPGPDSRNIKAQKQAKGRPRVEYLTFPPIRTREIEADSGLGRFEREIDKK